MGPTDFFFNSNTMSAPRGTKSGSTLPRQRHVSKTALQNRRGSQIALVSLDRGVVLSGFLVKGYELDSAYN
jgi:hypothetical protein